MVYVEVGGTVEIKSFLVSVSWERESEKVKISALKDWQTTPHGHHLRRQLKPFYFTSMEKAAPSPLINMRHIRKRTWNLRKYEHKEFRFLFVWKLESENAIMTSQHINGQTVPASVVQKMSATVTLDEKRGINAPEQNRVLSPELTGM